MSWRYTEICVVHITTAHHVEYGTVLTAVEGVRGIVGVVDGVFWIVEAEGGRGLLGLVVRAADYGGEEGGTAVEVVVAVVVGAVGVGERCVQGGGERWGEGEEEEEEGTEGRHASSCPLTNAQPLLRINSNGGGVVWCRCPVRNRKKPVFLG